MHARNQEYLNNSRVTRPRIWTGLLLNESYQVGSLVEQGATTELYDGVEVSTGEPVALKILLPQLAEVLAVVVVFRTIWTFNKFEEIYLLTRGGPGTSTFNLAVYAFEQATANLKLGVAAATGVVMLVFLFASSALYLRMMRQEEA